MPSLIDYLATVLAVIVGNLILFYSITNPATSRALTFIIVFLPLLLFILVSNLRQVKTAYWCLIVSIVAIISNFGADILIFNFTDSVRPMLINGTIMFGFLFIIMVLLSHVAHFIYTIIPKKKK